MLTTKLLKQKAKLEAQMENQKLWLMANTLLKTAFSFKDSKKIHHSID